MGDPSFVGMSSPVRPKDIPVFGDYWSKAGRIYSMYMSPCDPDAMLMVQMWLVNLPYLAWAAVKPDPNDKVFNRWGLGHKKRRRGRFNFDELNLPEKVPSGGLVWVSWKIAQAAQKLGYFFMIIDAGLDFNINWMSSAFQMTGCNTPVNWNGAISLANEPHTSNGTFGPVSNAWAGNFGHQCVVGGDGMASTVPTQDVAAQMTFNIGPQPGFPFMPPKNMWLRVSASGGFSQDLDGRIGDDGAGGLNYSSSGNMGPMTPRRWIITPMKHEGTGGHYLIRSGFCYAGSTGQKSFIGDP